MTLNDETLDLMRQYEETFGENVPMMMMPYGDEAIAALLRECIEARSSEPIMRRYPPDVFI